MKKFLVILCVLALGFLLWWWLGNTRNFDWNIGEGYVNDSDQPYGMMLFDSLLTRSLSNGYTVERLPNATDSYLSMSIPQNADTNLLIVINHDIFSEIADDENSDDETANTLTHDYIANDIAYRLCDFANKGGKAVLVYAHHNIFPSDQAFYDASKKRLFEPVRNLQYYSDNPHPDYSPQWLAGRSSEVRAFKMPNGATVDIDMRYVVTSYTVTYKGDLDAINKKREDECQNVVPPIIAEPIIVDELTNKIRCGMLVNGKKGGALYINTLGMYFCNLGLTIDDGSDVIEAVMTEIDDRPVKRIEWGSFVSPHRGGSELQGDSFLDRVFDNDALCTAWWLMLIFALLVLVSGSVRRYPVVHGAENLQPDRSDIKGLRNWRFKRSPLMQFLYQCSWLYKGQRDYTDLFDVNFFRISRVVSRRAGIELRVAADNDLKRAADILAAMFNLDKDAVFTDLCWMRDTRNKTSSYITKSKYKRSQSIVDRYPVE